MTTQTHVQNILDEYTESIKERYAFLDSDGFDSKHSIFQLVEAMLGEIVEYRASSELRRYTDEETFASSQRSNVTNLGLCALKAIGFIDRPLPELEDLTTRTSTFLELLKEDDSLDNAIYEDVSDMYLDLKVLKRVGPEIDGDVFYDYFERIYNRLLLVLACSIAWHVRKDELTMVELDKRMGLSND